MFGDRGEQIEGFLCDIAIIFAFIHMLIPFLGRFLG